MTQHLYLPCEHTEQTPIDKCGGAHSRSRSTAIPRRPRRPRGTTTPSNRTGRQTVKPRKAGARVTSKNTFVGEGMVLVDKTGEGKGKGKGTGFGKQAASKRAREERALAAERRILALQAQPVASTSMVASEWETDSDGDEETLIYETDSERRQTLLSSEQNNDLQALKSGTLWDFLQKDVVSGDRAVASHVNGMLDHEVISGTEASTTGFAIGKRKRKNTTEEGKNPAKKAVKSPATPLGIGNLVQSEIDYRKKESLGMVPVNGGGRALGTGTSGAKGLSHNVSQRVQTQAPTQQQWTCLVCTLCNKAEHPTCSACATSRGEKTWTQRS